MTKSIPEIMEYHQSTPKIINMMYLGNLSWCPCYLHYMSMIIHYPKIKTIQYNITILLSEDMLMSAENVDILH